MRHVVPRWGGPKKLTSDNGEHFVNKTFKILSEKLQTGFRTHCAYQPQSAVANSMLKAKLTKIIVSTEMGWVTAFPLAFFYLRGRSSKSTGFSTFEILTGRPLPAPGYLT